MGSREPLTNKERSQVQWAYHKGTSAQKEIIQRFFGRHITHASCMAMVDMYVRRAELKGKAKAVAKPTETELWDWLCCAAYHGLIWNPDSQGRIRYWIEIHCQAMGESTWEEAEPLMFERHITPPPICKTNIIRLYLFARRLPKFWREVLGAIGIVWVLERLQEIIISFSGNVS